MIRSLETDIDRSGCNCVIWCVNNLKQSGKEFGDISIKDLAECYKFTDL